MANFKHALVLTTLENLALTMIRTLAAKGIKATVAGAGPGRLLRLSRHCSAYVPVARGGAEYAQARDQALERAARLARERGADLVVPVDVPGGMFAEKLKARLPGPAFFPSASSESLRLLDDKWTFYGLLQKHGLPAPRTVLLENAAQARGLPFPLVLKPLREAGGAGVCVARDAAARDARLGGSSPHRFPTLAQEYVSGEDVSLSFLADRGRLLAWAAHMRRPDGAVDYVSDERVVELGRAIARAAAYTGVANVDMRYDGPGRDRVLVLECNPRFWGTYKYTLGLGVDFLERGLALAAGRDAEPFPGAPRAVVPGLFAAVKRLARGRPVPSASRPYLRQKLGDPVPELYCGARAMLGLRGSEP